MDELKKLSIENKEMKERFAETEGRLSFQSKLLSNISDVVYATDPDMRVTAWNKAAEKVYGMKEKDALGKSVFEVTGSKLDPRKRSELARELMSKGSVTAEIEHVSGPGKKLIFESVTIVLKDSSGDVTGFLAVNHDVTERRRAEDILRESEARFRGIVETSQEGIWLGDSESRTRFANKRLAEMMGYNREEVVGKSLLDFLAEEDRALTEKNIERRKKGLSDRYEQKYMRKDGSALWTITSASPMFDIKGKYTGTLAMITDITERKKAEDALILSEDKFRSFMDNSPGIAWLKDTNGRYTYLNKTYADRFGFKAEGIIGKTDFDFWPEENARVFWQNDLAVLNDSKPRQVEEAARGKDGKTTFWLVSKFVIAGPGGKKYIAGQGIEITERKRAEDILMRSEKDFRLLTEEAPEPIYIRVGERFAYVNLAAVKLFGARSKEQLVGMPVMERFHPDSREIISKRIEHLNERWEGVPNVEVRYLRLDNSVIDVEASAVPYVFNGQKGSLVFSRDITGRKQAEKEIAHFASFPLNNPSPILEVNAAGQIVFSNTAASKFLDEKGLSNQTTLFLPEDFKSILEALRSAKNNRLYSREVEIKDSVFIEAISVLPETQTIRIYTQDITVRKQAEDLLLKDEEELRKLNRTLNALSHSNRAIMRAKDELSYLKEACRIVVEDCGHMMAWIGFAELNDAKTVRPVAQSGFENGYLETADISWADNERGRGPTGIAIRTGEPSICANMLTDPKFKPWREEALKRGYASSIALPLVSGDGVFGALTIYSKEPDPFSKKEVELLSELADDLAFGIQSLRLRADHARIEEAMISSRNLLQSIIDNTLNLVYVIDLEGRIVIANKIVADGFNSSPRQLLGRKRNEFMPEYLAKQHEDNDKEVVKSGKPQQFEENVNFKGRSATFLSTKFPLFDPHGKIYAVAGISTDISDRKKVENILKRDKDTFERLVKERTKELIDAQLKLESAKRLSDIGVLAATVAHELRNPLAAIGMAAYNIKNKAKNPDLEKHLINIDKKIKESDRIISNLLFYSRLKPPDFERVEILGILEDALETSRHRQNKEVSVVKDTGALKNLFIDADPIQLNEVFNNILNNAFEAVETVKGKIQITAENEGQFIKIAFQDNGHGIDKYNFPRVFDPFFTTKAQGTGLGLSVCKQIVTFHNGSISIESKLGQGTTVNVWLPKERQNAP